MTDDPAVLYFVPAADAPTHEVLIYDKTARALADIFLPPNGTRISGEELQAAVERLVEATNAVKRLEAES